MKPTANHSLGRWSQGHLQGSCGHLLHRRSKLRRVCPGQGYIQGEGGLPKPEAICKVVPAEPWEGREVKGNQGLSPCERFCSRPSGWAALCSHLWWGLCISLILHHPQPSQTAFICDIPAEKIIFLTTPTPGPQPFLTKLFTFCLWNPLLHYESVMGTASCLGAGLLCPLAWIRIPVLPFTSCEILQKSDLVSKIQFLQTWVGDSSCTNLSGLSWESNCMYAMALVHTKYLRKVA